MKEKLVSTTIRLPHSEFYRMKLTCAKREMKMGEFMAIAIKQYVDKYEKVIEKTS